MKSVLYTIIQFTLALALLAVIIISIPIFQHRHQLHNALTNNVGYQFRFFEQLLKFYKEDNGEYPKHLELLIPNYSSELPLDPWGNNYIYSIENGKPLIITLGSDNKKGGKNLERDLNSGMNVKDFLK